ncbi:MAG: type I secretion C-terminal target domain-containing protein, partial [Methylotenera sp.]
GSLALNYSIYNVHGELLGQISSNSEAGVAMGFAGIGKIVIDSGGFSNPFGTVEDISYRTILDTVVAAAPAPEVITYTITDNDGDTSSSTLTLNNIIDDIAGTAANNIINGTARNENISGLVGDDTINAGAGYDVVRGGDGNDSIDGGADDDQLYGNAGNDTISGGTGKDQIYGDAGNDTLNGNDGDDFTSGGAGNDTINGGAGNDVIIGGAGDDSLTGGLGADVFKWELVDQGAKLSPAKDIVTDFDSVAGNLGGDVLDLRDLLVGENTGNLANYLHFEKSVSGLDTIIHVSSNGEFANGFNASKDVQTITLNNVDLIQSFTNDQDIVADLISKQKLITD